MRTNIHDIKRHIKELKRMLNGEKMSKETLEEQVEYTYSCTHKTHKRRK